MTISPLPRHGDVIVGRDVTGRTLRISGHPESGRVVLSIWQDNVCRATLRLAPEDVPLVRRDADPHRDHGRVADDDVRDLGTAG